jgi:4-methyl-5(b-hydroxyethyl)-thiazole monophosphate biosynthesis
MIYVFFASGFEEIEGLAVVDILRRAKLAVTTVGIGAKCVTGSHNITVCCDTQDDEVSPTDSVEAVILPGGMPGTKNLESSACVQAFIDFAAQTNQHKSRKMRGSAVQSSGTKGCSTVERLFVFRVEKYWRRHSN